MYDFDATQFNGEISLSVDVKTIKADGIIFYVGHSDNDNFVSLYLRESNVSKMWLQHSPQRCLQGCVMDSEVCKSKKKYKFGENKYEIGRSSYHNDMR